MEGNLINLQNSLGDESCQQLELECYLQYFFDKNVNDYLLVSLGFILGLSLFSVRMYTLENNAKGITISNIYNLIPLEIFYEICCASRLIEQFNLLSCTYRPSNLAVSFILGCHVNVKLGCNNSNNEIDLRKGNK